VILLNGIRPLVAVGRSLIGLSYPACKPQVNPR
jgi:hypothetical protein